MPSSSALSLALVLLGSLPHLLIRLHTNLLAGVELVVAAKIHRLVQERDHVFVESLPVPIRHQEIRISSIRRTLYTWSNLRVLEVVLGSHVSIITSPL
jgi:hypothetical protein